MYADILKGLIFDAVYDSQILSLPLFTLATNTYVQMCFVVFFGVVLANLTIFVDDFIYGKTPIQLPRYSRVFVNLLRYTQIHMKTVSQVANGFSYYVVMKSMSCGETTYTNMYICYESMYILQAMHYSNLLQ